MGLRRSAYLIQLICLDRISSRHLDVRPELGAAVGLEKKVW
jgi:hypothetical protein